MLGWVKDFLIIKAKRTHKKCYSSLGHFVRKGRHLVCA